MSRFLAYLLLFPVSNVLQAADLSVATYNLESGGAEYEKVAAQLEVLREANIDLFGLSEVDPAWESALNNDFGEGWRYILGNSGRNDRLAIFYDERKFELLQDYELDHINPGNRVRAPLVAQFLDRKTYEQLVFVVNHFYRSDSAARKEQAQKLNKWAAQQALPVIAVGDFNFDWSLKNGSRDAGFDELTRHDVFNWVIPSALRPSQCDPEYQSILDFVFVSGRAQKWLSKSEILDSGASYCEDVEESDHVPVTATFSYKAKE